MRTCSTFLTLLLHNFIIKDSISKYLLVKIEDVNSEEPISRTIFACNKERNGCSIFEKCCNGLECKGIPFFRTCQKTKVEHEVDCKWGPWGEWTTCSKECGGGRKSRSRPVATPASDGGKPCEGNSTQWEDCNTQACDIDCEWGPWSEWSSCSKTCGWGVKSISRQVAKPAIHGGKPCEGSGIKHEACNIQACVDCKWGPWGDWSSCSKTCGGGRKSQSRQVATPASDDGKPCEGAVTKWQSCNKQGCPVPCEFGPWSGWSSCSKSCGCGLKTKSRPVITPPLNGGACYADKSWKSCNNQACPGDCEFGSWSAWSSCSKCGGEHGGEKSRTRKISRTASNKCGNCEGETTQTVACFEDSCPELTTSCKNLKNKVRCSDSSSSSEIFLPSANSLDTCPSECEKAGDGAKGCCEWQHDWKKCMWTADVRSTLEAGGINRSAIMCSNEETGSCNEEVGNKVQETLQHTANAPFSDCKTAFSYYQTKLENDTDLICGQANQELLTKFVFKRESKEQQSRNMQDYAEPIREDVTFGEICNCTCKKEQTSATTLSIATTPSPGECRNQLGSKGDDKGICCTYADHRLHESYKPCMFPFSFKNHTFNTCIVTKRDGPICPTSNQHDDWYIKFTYGTCDQGVCKNFKREEDLHLKTTTKANPTPTTQIRPTISQHKKCCEMRGVPDKCMYACGGSTATIEARGNPSCMNYIDVIENCRNGPTLEDCCNQHDVYKESPDCYRTLCTSKCENKPWKFFEKYPKKECEKYLNLVSSCCGDI